MVRFGRGLIVGKFRPPHKGHGLLIRTALEQCTQLTVAVCADASDSIPADLRADWLRELYPAADIRVVETSGTDPDDSRYWATEAIRWLGSAPDAVFTSEAYGETWARALGCTQVSIDQLRGQVPIAASRILSRPLAYLEFLEPCVRAYFIPRVALLGADSTGKTTLARALAAHYGTTWVPEYGRTYWEGLLTLPLVQSTTADFMHIIEAQRRLEDRLARHAHRVLICDTDALATRLWHERYLAHDDPTLRMLADPCRYALYLLTGDEIPWEDDGTRDPFTDRPLFQARFREELAATATPVTLVEGPHDRRLSVAIDAIDHLLADVGDPIAAPSTPTEVLA